MCVLAVKPEQQQPPVRSKARQPDGVRGDRLWEPSQSYPRHSNAIGRGELNALRAEVRPLHPGTAAMGYWRSIHATSVINAPFVQ